MISLKQLFWLMGSVSTFMIAALLYTKLGANGHVSFGEVRAIDRLCQRQADSIMQSIVERDGPIKDELQFLKRVHHCLLECRIYLVTSRAKGSASVDKELLIPECLAKGAPGAEAPSPPPKETMDEQP